MLSIRYQRHSRLCTLTSIYSSQNPPCLGPQVAQTDCKNPDDRPRIKPHSHHRPPFLFHQDFRTAALLYCTISMLTAKKCLIDNRYPRLLIRQILDTLVPVTTNVLSCPPFEKIPFCSPISYSICASSLTRPFSHDPCAMPFLSIKSPNVPQF
jgi:hypothetical protein